MSRLFICGIPAGIEKKHRCPCCGFESDALEAFATSMCWACGLGGNWDCANCLEHSEVACASMGRAVSRYHLLRPGRMTACGLSVDDSWTGPGFCVRCEDCWPPETGLSARVRQPLPWTALYWWGPGYKPLGRRVYAGPFRDAS